MKFKDKKGNVFEDIVDAAKIYCWGRDCVCCGMYEPTGSDDCIEFAAKHPAEAARLMGCEVVEDEKCKTCINDHPGVECVNCGTKHWNYRPKEETNMDKQKPLSEWTLGEVKEWCKKLSDCDEGCPFQKGYDTCRLDEAPVYWDFDEKPRWTEQDKEDARAILRLFPWAEMVRRYGNELQVRASGPDGRICGIETTVLPGVEPGSTVRLSEITGEG